MAQSILWNIFFWYFVNSNILSKINNEHLEQFWTVYQILFIFILGCNGASVCYICKTINMTENVDQEKTNIKKVKQRDETDDVLSMALDFRCKIVANTATALD